MAMKKLVTATIRITATQVVDIQVTEDKDVGDLAPYTLPGETSPRLFKIIYMEEGGGKKTVKKAKTKVEADKPVDSAPQNKGGCGCVAALIWLFFFCLGLAFFLQFSGCR